MDTLTALHSRTSCPRLTEPAPTDPQMQNIILAAMRAADHALLQPWRFIRIQGDSLTKLGNLFLEAALAADADLSTVKQERILSKPQRAPTIVVSISCIQDHPKVPEFEQDLSAAAATQNMLLASYAQGVGAMWRTGSMAYSDIVKAGLGLAANEKIIGFLYLGAAAIPPREATMPKVQNYLQDW